MKIWNSYGSEHSAKLVMIGRFKDAATAESTKETIDKLTRFSSSPGAKATSLDRFSDEALGFLKDIEFHSIAPNELEQFGYDVSSEIKDNQITLETDEIEVSGYLKLFIDRGARIEVYSAHDFPDDAT